jgi:muconolactone D-isomerase
VLYQVHIIIRVPHDADMEKVKELSAAEGELARKLQRKGKWRHLWRIAGKWANISIFDVEDAEELHKILSSLPLFPYMELDIIALCRHPASIEP